MTSCDIIVSYYNNKNFLELLDLFGNKFLYNYKGIVYNKSGYEIMLKNHTIQKHLDNIGREGATYLNHIINNYNNLSEYTIFMQDDTNDHISDYNKFINFCNNIINKKQQFALYPSSWRRGHRPVLRTITNGICDLHTLPSKDSIKICCEKHGINLPKQYTTETCAFFICHKNSILNYEKKFYIKLLEWLLSEDGNGYVLEHIWKLIFTHKAAFKC
tara:strand:+ start:191 stop:838 length:648 start_codon:yes stop_codon:yes gene_type:complete